MYISETFVNETKGYRFGETGPFEAWTDDKGKLFRSLRQEYGRCTGRVYVDTDGKTKPVGWVFEKRMKYEDARGNDREQDYYTRSVWVTLHTALPTRTTKYHYA